MLFSIEKVYFWKLHKEENAFFYFCLGSIFANTVKSPWKMFTTIEQIGETDSSTQPSRGNGQLPSLRASALAFKQHKILKVFQKLPEPNSLFKKPGHC